MAVLRIGIVQYASRNNRLESLGRVRDILSKHRVEAEFILLPEYADTTPLKPRHEIEASSTTIEANEFVRGLENIAVEYSAYIAAGVLERRGDCSYSSIVLVEPSGAARVVYRKRVLFDALGFQESNILCPGLDESPIVEVKSVKTGFAVCFELRFPELFRRIALNGAQLAVVPSAWYSGSLKEEQLAVFARARAGEETMYVAVANQYSQYFTGRSMVVDPYTVKVLDMGQGERYGETIVDTSIVDEAREKLPLLDIYKKRLAGHG